jgi:hypothetical protein
MSSVNVPLVMGSMTAVVDVVGVSCLRIISEIEVVLADGTTRTYSGSAAEVLAAHEKLTAALMKLYPASVIKAKTVPKPRKRAAKSADEVENGDSETVAHAHSAPEMKGVEVAAIPPAVKRSKKDRAEDGEGKDREKLKSKKALAIAAAALLQHQHQHESEAETDAGDVEGKADNEDDEE